MTAGRVFSTVASALFLVATLAGASTAGARAVVVLTADPVAGKTGRIFSGYDTVYGLVTVSGLEPGDHAAVVNWVDPAGNISQQTPLTFRVAAGRSSYTFTSWLRLMRNGPIRSSLTGKSFDDRFLGAWEIHVFVDDAMLARTGFSIR